MTTREGLDVGLVEAEDDVPSWEEHVADEPPHGSPPELAGPSRSLWGVQAYSQRASTKAADHA
jgi:hypothetical protein